jgi:hypothetical protein
LRRLVTRRKTREAQQRLANDQLTRAYLEAGLRLIAQQIQARPASGSARDADDVRPFFDWLSQKMVVEEVARAGKLMGSLGSFRDRWEFRGDYIEDLISYSLWTRHASASARISASLLDLGTQSADFVSAVHTGSYRAIRAKLESAGLGVSILGAATAARNDATRETTAETYRIVTDAWRDLYQAILEARNLRLRPGISLDDITRLLTAVAEGLALRHIADPDAHVIDADRHESLLGKAVLTVIAGCIDTGDGRSLEDVVRDISAAGQASPASAPYAVPVTSPRASGEDPAGRCRPVSRVP